MKKLCLLFAFVFLFLPLASCSAGLEAVTEDASPSVTTKKPVQKKTDETEEKSIMQDYDPAEDDVINVLMIGASSSYYYVEELYGVAKAAGVDMKVCNVYYSGCSLKQHWTWWKLNESHYQYFETDGRGRRKALDPTNLISCLRRENWDVISFQQAVQSSKGDLEHAKNTHYKYLSDLYEFIKEQFPESKFYWHQRWAYQVGYDRSDLAIENAQQQAEMARWYKEFAVAVCEDFPLTRVPTGDAWQYARQDSRVGDVLCNRGDKSDNYHDGDEGGGQYLNACVWFETLTGQSCIGNTYRPDSYKLSESKISALQQAAHRAVEESRG